METIQFSHNWNGKLGCRYFTTLRRPDKRYALDRVFMIIPPEGDSFKAMVVDIKQVLLSTMNNFVAAIDTGYMALEAKTMFRKMYSLKEDDDLLLLMLLLRRCE